MMTGCVANWRIWLGKGNGEIRLSAPRYCDPGLRQHLRRSQRLCLQNLSESAAAIKCLLSACPQLVLLLPFQCFRERPPQRQPDYTLTSVRNLTLITYGFVIALHQGLQNTLTRHRRLNSNMQKYKTTLRLGGSCESVCLPPTQSLSKMKIHILIRLKASALLQQQPKPCLKNKHIFYDIGALEALCLLVG